MEDIRYTMTWRRAGQFELLDVQQSNVSLGVDAHVFLVFPDLRILVVKYGPIRFREYSST